MYQIELWQRSFWQKNTRFYTVELCQNLFGDWIVKKTWGSAVRLDYGRSNSVVCSDYQSGLEEYQKQQLRRRVRGYEFLSI
ncbi:WGR domain-containing protein [Myxosarcina sp. GI1]|uniref:WGR domain-containing protein n=1 Tax=Myxosarcina sp. GI1 TaxID=1541065 RepID=UPI00055E4EA0|nr:WGR domain-containing protein [Myxosarcina sp. GI1]